MGGTNQLPPTQYRRRLPEGQHSTHPSFLSLGPGYRERYLIGPQEIESRPRLSVDGSVNCWDWPVG